MAKTLAGSDSVWVGDTRCTAYQACSKVGAAVRATGPVEYEITPGLPGGKFRSGGKLVAIHGGDSILDARTGKKLPLSLQPEPGPGVADWPDPSSHVVRHQDLEDRIMREHQVKTITNPLTGKTDDVFNVFCSGDDLMGDGKPDLALRCYDAILKHEPDNVNAMCSKCRALVMLNRFTDAHLIIDPIMKIVPVSPQAARIKASILGMERRFEDGLEFTERQLAIRPYDKHMIDYKIMMLNCMERNAEAVEFIEECLNVKPEDVIALHDKYLAIDEPDLDLLNAALDMIPQDQIQHFPGVKELSERLNMSER